MMISYPGLSKLKTKPVVYQNVLLACDSDTLEQLRELSSKRKAIDSINESNSITEAIAREMSGGLTSCCEQDIQKLENYLPLLENLVRCINLNGKNRKLISLISDLKIRWSSVLTSSSIFQRSKLYQINDMYFELGMNLFLYGALLRERATEVLSSDLVLSATLFRKAAGVYSYLAEGILVNLHWNQERPPESIPSVSSVMSLICLAEAQDMLGEVFVISRTLGEVGVMTPNLRAVTARKSKENGNSEALLVKLHWGVREFLVEAMNMLHIASKESKDFSSRLLDFILSCKMLHELTSYKYHVLGLKDEGKIGIAIGILRWSLADAKKNMPKDESWRLVSKQAIDELTKLLQKYEHENEFVWYEKVPPYSDELPLPKAVRIVSLIPYEPKKWEKTLALKL